MTTDEVVAALATEVPEVQPIVDEHLRDNDELLVHLSAGDLRRYAVEAFESGQTWVLRRLLAAVLDRALLDGDDRVTNAVAISFVEDSGWWEPDTQPFIESWPPGLQAEARRQQEWRST